MSWKISQSEYKKLVSYMGCGDLPNAQIVVFGIEEGVGGNDVEENVMARANTFGNIVDGKYLSAINPLRWEEGYWEPDAQEGGNKVRAYRGMEPRGPFLKGAFNPLIARMTSELDHPQMDSRYWFQLFPDNRDAEKAIKTRIGSLYKTESIDHCTKVALMDWYPLPRPKMDSWPDQYSRVNHDLYFRAFSNPHSNVEYSDTFSCYSEDAKRRFTNLKAFFTKYPKPLVIGLGKIEMKRGILTSLFPELHFERFESSVFPNHPGLHGTMNSQAGIMNVFLLPFPDPVKGGWYRYRSANETAGRFALRYYQEVTQNYIKPALKNDGNTNRIL